MAIDLDNISAADRAVLPPSWLVDRVKHVTRQGDPMPHPDPGKTLHGNVPTIYRGIRYDSKAEAHHAMNLNLMVTGGTVAWWLRQIFIPLGPDFGTRVDFLVARRSKWILPASPDTFLIVEAHEVKGHENERFKRIRKLWPKYAQFPMHIIKRGVVEVIQGA